VDLLLLELPAWVDGFLQDFSYLGPFVILLLCGVGLPLPEEVTLIASGLLLHQGKVEFLPITVVCSVAILLGDSLPYWLGRRMGKRALEWRLVAKVLHPERFAIVEEKFQRYGSWGIFFCRFLPGIRIPGYFSAGTLRMSYVRFLILDGLGVLSGGIADNVDKTYGLIQDKLQSFEDRTAESLKEGTPDEREPAPEDVLA